MSAYTIDCYDLRCLLTHPEKPRWQLGPHELFYRQPKMITGNNSIDRCLGPKLGLVTNGASLGTE